MSRTPPPLKSWRDLGLAIERAWQAAQRRAVRQWSRARTRGRDPEIEEVAGRGLPGESRLSEHLVHTAGIREACDVVVDLGCAVFPPGRFPWPVDRVASLAPTLGAGTTIYAKTDRLNEWVQVFLPRLQRPVVLVTGDSDIAPVRRFPELLEHPMVSHWFVQNCDIVGRHARLTRIPIGLDNPVYTIFEKRVEFAVQMALGKIPFEPTFTKNRKGDQATIRKIRKKLPRPEDRAPLCLCTFHQNQIIVQPDLSGVPWRAEAFQELANNPACYFIERRLRQNECWELHGQFAFQVSPHGHGLDCFRTWESLYLGTIPIVKTSTLDPLYLENELPVVIVKSWSEITPENLATWKRQFQPLFAEVPRRLSLDYWVAKIRHASREAAVAL